VMAQALVEMRGTTSPRLVLELACARVLLPAVSEDPSATLARLERLERRVPAGGAGAAAPPVVRHVPTSTEPASTEPASREPASREMVPAETAPTETVPTETVPTETVPTESVSTDRAPADPVPDLPVVAEAPAPAAEPQAASGVLDVAAVRRVWDDILDAVKSRNRGVHAQLKEYGEVVAVDTRSVTVRFGTPAIARMFSAKADVFRDAVRSVVGTDLQVVTVTGEAAPAVREAARHPAPEPGGGSPAAGTVPSDHDVVDLSESTDLASDTATDPLALLQQNLGAQVIGEIDSA
jgi:DNA polymerase III subunit gamma/tau